MAVVSFAICCLFAAYGSAQSFSPGVALVSTSFEDGVQVTGVFNVSSGQILNYTLLSFQRVYSCGPGQILAVNFTYPDLFSFQLLALDSNFSLNLLSLGSFLISPSEENTYTSGVVGCSDPSTLIAFWTQYGSPVNLTVAIVDLFSSELTIVASVLEPFQPNDIFPGTVGTTSWFAYPGTNLLNLVGIDVTQPNNVLNYTATGYEFQTNAAVYPYGSGLQNVLVLNPQNADPFHQNAGFYNVEFGNSTIVEFLNSMPSPATVEESLLALDPNYADPSGIPGLVSMQSSGTTIYGANGSSVAFPEFYFPSYMSNCPFYPCQFRLYLPLFL